MILKEQSEIMSKNISKIEKLIEGLCPEGVKFLKISEFARITIGEFVHKNKQNSNGKYPVINGGISETGIMMNIILGIKL